MKKSLIELVQDIMASINSDEVSSIGDTTEAYDVARIIRDCYETLVVETDPKLMTGVFHLTPSGDPDKPVLMSIPKTVSEMFWVKYSVSKDLDDIDFVPVKYLPLDEFLEYTNRMKDPWVKEMVFYYNGEPFKTKYHSDQFPKYYTTLDDETLLFDAVDKTVEDTLTSSRSYCLGVLGSHFIMDDHYIPQIAESQFPLLLNMAKSQAFIELRQIENSISTLREKRLKIIAKKRSDITDTRDTLEKLRGAGFGRNPSAPLRGKLK